MTPFQKTFDLFLNNKTGAENFNSNIVFAAVENALLIREYVPNGINQHVLAYRVGGQNIGNSSKIEMSHHNSKDLRSLEILSFQVEMSLKISMIPFVVLKQADLKLSEYREIDRTSDETVKIKMHFNGTKLQFEKQILSRPENEVTFSEESEAWNGTLNVAADYIQSRHFTGARLFQCGSKVFLMDIDRVEVENYIFNPFLVEIPDTKVKTVSEAYEALKPESVKQAEKENKKVLRQGEWFLIDAGNVVPLGEIKPGFLRVGRNRPNRAEKYFSDGEKHFVSGVMSHTGREHKELILESWYLAVPNTSSNSFQISGDID